MAFTDATETVVTYNLNGSQREFNIPFDYLSRSFVQVSVFGENTDKRLVVGDDYNYLDSRTISTVRALGGSDGWKRLQIRRYTSDDRIVDFKDGSVLKSADLNVAVVQALHIAAEGRDGKFDLMGVNSEGNWDALDRKINRLAPGTERRDAVNLGQVQDWSNSALNQADRAKREADNASRSAVSAKVSETNAKSSESAAKTSASDAHHSMVEAAKSQAATKTSETNAKTSETNAKTSETNAKTSETNAKVDADRSYREAERAKGYADSMGNAIDIGKVIDRIDPATQDVYWKATQYAAKNYVAQGLNFQVRPSSKPGFAIEMGVNQGAATAHYAWKKDNNSSWNIMYYPEENNATFATREWVNKYLATSSSSIAMYGSNFPRSWAVNADGNIGVWDMTARKWSMVLKPDGTMHQTGSLKVGQSDYAGLELTRADGSYVRIECNPKNAASLLTFVDRTSSGANQNVVTVPQESGTLATQQWANSQYVRKAPSWRRLWTGKFAHGDTITLSESIIGKVIAVRSYDRSRWETIHVLWAGSWATGCGGSVNMFTVASNGRTLTSNYENEGGYWTEVWVVE